MKKAHYDSLTGEILGFYDTTIHPVIPTPNISLTDNEWMDCLNHNGLRRINVVTKTIVVYTPPPLSINDAAAQRIEALNKDCELAIVSGFASAALGTPHTYQSDRDDQLNLIGAASTNTDMPFKCADGAGVWGYRVHTAAQFKQVLANGAAVKLGHLQAFADKQAQVEAIVADTVLTDDEKRTAIDAVVW